jgi:hypothetical protein
MIAKITHGGRVTNKEIDGVADEGSRLVAGN